MHHNIYLLSPNYSVCSHTIEYMNLCVSIGSVIVSSFYFRLYLRCFLFKKKLVGSGIEVSSTFTCLASVRCELDPWYKYICIYFVSLKNLVLEVFFYIAVFSLSHLFLIYNLLYTFIFSLSLDFFFPCFSSSLWKKLFWDLSSFYCKGIYSYKLLLLELLLLCPINFGMLYFIIINSPHKLFIFHDNFFIR